MVDLAWYGILQIIGALALFIYGLKVMSEGVQRIASLQMRDALQRVTQNKFSSFLTGFFTSAVTQSSSATTIMTVSFVNAGIVSLTAAAGIIVGANMGSVVSVWFVTILGFELNLFTFCLPLIALAMPFIYLQNGKYRQWAETVIGFALLLIGIQFLKSVVPEIQQRSEVMAFLGQLGDHGIYSIIIFTLIGVVITALIQSSSAAIALTFAMCLNGWVPFEIGAAMILGENIGTTIATEIASWVGNNDSKKAARIHVLFNLVGVILFLPFFTLILPAIDWLMDKILHLGSPFQDAKASPIALSIFYSFFYIICTGLALLLLNRFIRLASGTVRHKPEEERKLFFIDTGINSADLSLPVAMQEIMQQCLRVKQINTILNRMINFTTEAEFHEQIRYVREYFTTLQEDQKAINRYLIGMVEDKSSLVTSKQIKSLLNINLLIEQIRLKYEHVYRLLIDKKQQRIWFGPTQRSTLLHRINDATVMLKRCIQLLQSSTFIKPSWRGMSLEQSEKNQDYQEYEKELLVELERGEMKLVSVVTYYRMAQLMDSINESLRAILNEFMDEPIRMPAVKETSTLS
jgi:phosphate:Na+ symporter